MWRMCIKYKGFLIDLEGNGVKICMYTRIHHHIVSVLRHVAAVWPFPNYFGHLYCLHSIMIF